MAKLLKITPQAYSLYETNKNNINNETLCILADFFEVSIDYLLGRQDQKPSFLSDEERNSLIKEFDMKTNSVMFFIANRNKKIAQKLNCKTLLNYN